VAVAAGLVAWHKGGMMRMLGAGLATVAPPTLLWP